MTSTRIILILLYFVLSPIASKQYDTKDLIKLREEVRSMFNHAYNSYLQYAYPYDELRSLSCDGFDTWGSFSLTLIDALDTLAVMGNYTEFRRVAEQIINSRDNFEANINVSVFETNIRVVGGLLSAHLLSKKAGMQLEDGWPCNGPLLRLAEDMAKRLIIAFDTPTGMPYGTVNLKYGIPIGETTITCTAGIGTFILEFGTLSRLTGNPLYEEVALNSIKALHYYKSKIGLVGNHVDVLTGHWTARDSGIGAGVDSYFEYLAKGTLLFQSPLLAGIFHEHKKAIEKYIRREDWHLWVTMTEGQVTLPVFQSLDAYWPGVLSLFGDIDNAMKSLHNYHRVWKQFGFTPEFYNIAQAEAGANREGYPLRPELIESVMYLYRATKDPYLIRMGIDVLRSLQHSARTTCGYATINDVRDHRKADRMESFFLAETTKYLYLLFDEDNFIHNNGRRGDIVKAKWGGECVVDAGGYIFNTEAHPIDPGALDCCKRTQSLFDDDHSGWIDLKKFRGEKWTKKPKESLELVKDDEIVEESDAEVENVDVNDENNDELIIEEDGLDEGNVKNQVVGPQIYNSSTLSSMSMVNDSDDADEDKRITMAEDLNSEETFEERIAHLSDAYPINLTLSEDYQVLSCESQPFLQRISIVGEFF